MSFSHPVTVAPRKDDDEIWLLYFAISEDGSGVSSCVGWTDSHAIAVAHQALVDSSPYHIGGATVAKRVRSVVVRHNPA